MPHLVQMSADYQRIGLQVVGVTDAAAEDAIRFVDEQSLPFPVLAAAQDLRKAFGVDMIWGSPAFLVDRNGVIVAEELGAVERYLEKQAKRRAAAAARGSGASGPP